jgi:hypothetical protein
LIPSWYPPDTHPIPAFYSMILRRSSGNMDKSTTLNPH